MKLDREELEILRDIVFQTLKNLDMADNQEYGYSLRCILGEIENDYRNYKGD